MKKRKAQKFSLLMLVFGGVLLLLAAIILAFPGQGNPFAGTTPVAGNSADETYPEIERVTLDAAKAALEAGTAVFVDVRGADVYALSRIAGSISIPATDLENRMGELDKNAWIITYCT